MTPTPINMTDEKATEGGYWQPVVKQVRLVNAAADLLAACEMMLPVIVDAIMHGMPVTEEVAAARNAAVAAIAKATGPVEKQGEGLGAEGGA